LNVVTELSIIFLKNNLQYSTIAELDDLIRNCLQRFVAVRKMILNP